MKLPKIYFEHNYGIFMIEAYQTMRMPENDNSVLSDIAGLSW